MYKNTVSRKSCDIYSRVYRQRFMPRQVETNKHSRLHLRKEIHMVYCGWGQRNPAWES